MSRFKKRFKELKARKEGAFIPFVVLMSKMLKKNKKPPTFAGGFLL